MGYGGGGVDAEKTWPVRLDYSYVGGTGICEGGECEECEEEEKEEEVECGVERRIGIIWKTRKKKECEGRRSLKIKKEE